MQPRVLVLRAAGINCDEETAAACELAGGRVERVHVNRLVAGDVRLSDFAALVIPGGFSYGDHLGAGKLLAVDLVHRLGELLHEFVANGRPVLGVCNGFQVLVKTGLLPGDSNPGTQTVTLAANERGHYECRWTQLLPEPESACIFTRGIHGPIALPVGHGEGRFVAADTTLDTIERRRQVVLRYADANHTPTTTYPHNPNGSARAIAGLCNPTGNVFGLMPHPDRAFLPQLHPEWLRGDRSRTTGDGLAIFKNMVAYAAS